jgi:hypothetical protein
LQRTPSLRIRPDAQLAPLGFVFALWHREAERNLDA